MTRRLLSVSNLHITPSETIHDTMTSPSDICRLCTNFWVVVAAACVPGQGCFFSNNYEYTDPVVAPPVFENFTSIPNLTDTSRITNLLNLTEELKATQPDGFR